MRKPTPIHDTGNSSPFDWQGKSSTFTAKKTRQSFNNANVARSVASSKISKRANFSLPGGSPNLPPEMMRSSK
jgi:hypothetical protein